MMIGNSRIRVLWPFLVVCSFSCASDELQGPGRANEKPTVWLSGRPPEGSLVDYRLHFFWGGWDPDGRISHYEYLVTNNETGVFDPCDTAIVNPCPGREPEVWNPVFGNDSIFQFTADSFVDSTNSSFRDNETDKFEFQRNHTFFLRSVDDGGLRSIPTHISFTSRTLSPTIKVTVPRQVGLNPALVPPITTFRWTAKDFISNEAEQQDPDSVRWIVVSTRPFGLPPYTGDEWANTLDYIRRTPDAPEWSDWHYYKAPNDSGKTWTSPHLDLGPYMFAIQAKDEAGAVTPVFDEANNVRRILASARSTGPILTVTNRFIGTLVTANTKTPLTIVDLPAGIPMEFEFSANAESYGGLVSGYRYGWDILDLNDDEDWDISYTPFVGPRARSPARTFFFGGHTFHIEAIDNSGFKSRVGITINIIPFSMNNDLLFIDDVLEPELSCGWSRTSGGQPCDVEHDAFWEFVLGDLENFNPAVDVVELGVAGISEVPLQTFADYKAVIWNSVGTIGGESASGLARVIRWVDPEQQQTGGKLSPNIVALYMAAGGKVLLVGNHIMSMVVNRTTFTPAFPIIFRYELAGNQSGRYPEQDVGKKGVGENSFAYSECCVNVLDFATIQAPTLIRSAAAGHGCPVHQLRDHVIRTDGLRTALPLDTFPQLDLRPEAAGDPTKFYHESKAGLTADIFNPEYFRLETVCRGVSELFPRRPCFQPIYGNGCLNVDSRIYGETTAFWTSVFGQRVPDSGGVAARSAVWGFQPVFFNPAQVKSALSIILFDEWNLQRVPTP